MARAELDVYNEQEGDVVVLSLVGPVDSATYDRFKERVDPVCRGGAYKVVFDCTRLSYINSKGIGLLAGLHRQVMINMGNMAFFGLNNRIIKTLDILGLGKRLRIYNSRQEALDSLILPGEKAVQE